MKKQIRIMTVIGTDTFELYEALNRDGWTMFHTVPFTETSGSTAHYTERGRFGMYVFLEREEK